MSTVVALRVDRILSQCSACDELRWHAIVLGGLVVLIVTRYRSAQGYPSIRNEILVLLMGVREPNNLPQINSGLLSTCPLSRLGSNVQSILAVTPSSLSKLARIFDIQSSLALTLSSFAKLRRDRVLHRISVKNRSLLSYVPQKITASYFLPHDKRGTKAHYNTVEVGPSVVPVWYATGNNTATMPPTGTTTRHTTMLANPRLC